MHRSSRRSRHVAALSALLALAAACGVRTTQNGAVQITAINPNTGSITGGASVTIEGAGLDDGTHTANVLFGSSPADVVTVTASSIQVTLPASLACGGVDVQVSNGRGSAFKPSAFNYTGGNNAIQVQSVSPAQGDIAGGTAVTITGAGFTGGVGISLGGVPLKNIQIVNDTTVTAMTPASTSGGQADLAVRNCASQASLPAAFMYVSGLHGAVIDMNVTTYINAAEFGTPTPQAYIDPYVAFVQPTTDTLVNPTPAPGTCVYNPTPPPAGNFTAVDAGTSIQLVSGAKTMTLNYQTAADGTTGATHGAQAYYYPYDASGNFTSSHYAIATYAAGAPYDFDAVGGQVPAFSLTGAFTTPSAFTASKPVSPSVTPTPVPRNGALQFAWSGGTPASFEIQVIGLNIAVTPVATTGILYCEVPDNGSYTISATDMSHWTATTGEFYFFMTRRIDTDFIVPSNGSTGSAIATYNEIGAVIAQ